MKTIVLSLTLVSQDAGKILSTLVDIKKEYPEAICIHALPLKKMLEKPIEEDIVYYLQKNFPNQLNMYNDEIGEPLRRVMRTVAVKLDAQVCVIGDVRNGVNVEVELYKNADLPIKYYTLD